MKTKQILLAVLFLGLIFTGCNSGTQTSSNPDDAVETEEHHHADFSEMLKLNHGEKWMVNDEMKPYVIKASELLNTYIENGGTDYAGLARQMKEQNNLLIKSCTMEGESHDELHKWLHPHIELVTALETAKDETEANKLIAELKESFETYNEYFQ